MSDLFDPKIIIMVTIGVLFVIGLIVNHCKTKRKRERQKKSEINPIYNNNVL